MTIFSDITAIIPAYNAQKHLAETLASLLPAEGLQVILIDDQSTDNTRKVAETFISRGLNMTILTGGHEGPGAARNIGLAHTKTKYCMFVDADDVVDIASLDGMVQLSGDVISISQYCQTRVETMTVTLRRQLIGQMVSVQMPDGNDELAFSTPGPMTKLYKMTMLNKHNIRFKERLHKGEDALFNVRCLLVAKSIAYYRAAFYHYRLNDDSLTHRFNFDIGQNTRLFVSELRQILKTDNLYGPAELNAMIAQSFVGDMMDSLMHVQDAQSLQTVRKATVIQGSIDWRLLTPKRRVLYYMLRGKLYGIVKVLQSKKQVKTDDTQIQFVTY